MARINVDAFEVDDVRCFKHDVSFKHQVLFLDAHPYSALFNAPHTAPLKSCPIHFQRIDAAFRKSHFRLNRHYTTKILHAS